MNSIRAEDIKDTAFKLDKIRKCHPEDYFYIKGWIHCLLQKANEKNGQPQATTYGSLTYLSHPDSIENKY